MYNIFLTFPLQYLSLLLVVCSVTELILKSIHMDPASVAFLGVVWSLGYFLPSWRPSKEDLVSLAFFGLSQSLKPGFPSTLFVLGWAGPFWPSCLGCFSRIWALLLSSPCPHLHLPQHQATCELICTFSSRAILNMPRPSPSPSVTTSC